MMRSYPSDLAARVRAVWPADARPLPMRLEALLDAAYHASFLRDEERPVTCRILVLPHAELGSESGPPSALLPLVFTSARKFDEHELRRLSPAASVHRALVGVDDGASELAIWGIVQSGPRWLQAAQGGRATEPPMPRCLVVRVGRPGQLIASCGSTLIAELRGGKLSDFSVDVFQAAWLGALFHEARAAALSDHRARSSVMLDERIANALVRHIAQQMLKRVIATMRSAHHGGMLLVGPPTCIADRFIRSKYEFRDDVPRRRFRGLVGTILEAVLARASAAGHEATVDFYRQITEPAIAELDEGLFEMSHLITGLASVDGAVLMTKRFEILGFGAEISGSLPPVHEVRRALDTEAETFTTEVVESVGTRHRAAYRLCAAVPEAVAIVVSQDGDVRFVNRHRDAVTYWNHSLGD